MKAVVIRRREGGNALEAADVEEPTAGPGEIVVRVRATGVNRADLLQRRGLYPAPPGAPPDICGLEFAGEVVQAGPGTRRRATGDRVMGLLGGGGYAERIVTHEDLALPAPSGLTWSQAAAIPEVFMTAYDALQLQLKVQGGENLLIHAAAGGVGTAAIQLARSVGATIFATTRSEEKLGLIRRLGADHAIATSQEDFTETVKRATGGGGIDAILDLVGGVYWEENLRCLAPRGRLILVGLVGGTRAETDLSRILRKRLHIIGTVLRSRSQEEKIELTKRFGEEILPLLADGRIRPVIDRVFSLEAASEAHQWMEDNRNAGKIVLEVP